MKISFSINPKKERAGRGILYYNLFNRISMRWRAKQVSVNGQVDEKKEEEEEQETEERREKRGRRR